MSKSSETPADKKKDKRAGKRKAAALRYRIGDDTAPVVIASGYGNIADSIIGIAEEKGIPVFKDDSAASLLCMLEVGRNIPEDLYEVIATIYMQILRVSSEIKHSQQPAEVGPAPRAEELRRQLDEQRDERLDQG